MADQFLCRRCVLEFRRRWIIRIPDQSTDRSLLYAGTEHDSGSRSHCVVRCLRNAGNRIDAVLIAGYAARQSLERWNAKGRVLVDQYRPGVDGPVEPVANRFDADVGIGRIWYVVRALCGILADRLG